MSSVAEAPRLSDREVIDVYDPARRPPQSFAYLPPVPRGGPVSLDLSQTHWFAPVLKRLVDLTRLPRNWDSYGGVAVTSTCATEALWFLVRLLEPASTAPWVVPLSHGGVQLEWHRDGIDLEVAFSPDGDEFALSDEAHGLAWEGEPEAALRGDVNLDLVLDALRAD